MNASSDSSSIRSHNSGVNSSLSPFSTPARIILPELEKTCLLLLRERLERFFDDNIGIMKLPVSDPFPDLGFNLGGKCGTQRIVLHSSPEQTGVTCVG